MCFICRRYVLDRVPVGTVDVILSYCHFCLNDTSLESLLPYLKEKGVGVISASPLSMGLLTHQGPPVWHPAPKPLKQAAKKAAECCSSRGADLTSVALKFAVQDARIQSTLVGMATPETVRLNVNTVIDALADGQSKAAESDAQLLQNLSDIFADVKNVTWPSGNAENSAMC